MQGKINSITQQDVINFRAIADDTTGPNAVDMYQTIAGKSAIYPGRGTVLGISYCGHKLAGEAGEFAEHLGKAMRDDDLITPLSDNQFRANKLTPERREALLKELGDVLWYVARLARELGVSLSWVMLMNLEKLYSRTERDKLRGSGDDR